METYHKIQTVYLRDPENKYRTLLDGQYAKPEFKYLTDCEWVFTEKIDGMNIRVGWDEKAKEVMLGGRTDRAQIPAALILELQRMLPKDTFHALYPDTPMTLYGEGYGAKIQKGGGNYIPDGVSFILFVIIINGNYLSRENVVDIANNLNIKVVPIVERGSLRKAVSIVRAGFGSLIGPQQAEGLVVRPSIELADRMGHRIITKIKCKDFARITP